jgi:ATP-binding cassette, subfamily F, member 3
LSGGEKSRLALVKLLLDPPNLLLMDEPTTHLDLASVEALIWAIEQYLGTIIFISHDVHFIRSIANHVVHVRHGVLTHYPGEYQYYVDRMAALAAAEAAHALSDVKPKSGEPPRNIAREQKRLAAAERQARYQERVSQRKCVKDLEGEIARLEQDQHDLTAELQDPKTYEDSGRVVAINRELSEGRELLERLTIEWETEATRLAELEADE